MPKKTSSTCRCARLIALSACNDSQELHDVSKTAHATHTGTEGPARCKRDGYVLYKQRKNTTKMHRRALASMVSVRRHANHSKQMQGTLHMLAKHHFASGRKRMQKQNILWNPSRREVCQAHFEKNVLQNRIFSMS